MSDATKRALPDVADRLGGELIARLAGAISASGPAVQTTAPFKQRRDPLGTLGDVVNIPMTGHFIGGCPIGDTPEHGVVDPYQRLYDHPGLHVIDGSTISANLGVNPSLTITAQSERAMAFWPNEGEPDPRPPLGTPYARIKPVTPKNPAVPGSAPGALRLPVVRVS